MVSGYPFVLGGKDFKGADNLLEYTLVYRFQSTKSMHEYVVKMERYVNHAYCVKFYDEMNVHNKEKYSLRTNTFEPRTIFYTIMDIMLDVLNRDEKASFFFIGAEDEHDTPGVATRRFRIYSTFVLSVVSDNKFEHYSNNDLSLYILVNKDFVEDTEKYKDIITEYIREIIYE